MLVVAQLLETSPERSALVILGIFGGLAIAGGVLHVLGILGLFFGIVGWAVRLLVGVGFEVWRYLLGWAGPWTFLGLMVGIIALGVAVVDLIPGIAVAAGSAALLAGMVACLAYMYLDMEQAQVERGYKALHNPLKGQELARDLSKYGPQTGIIMLAGATVGLIGGFALLNEALYWSVGETWYHIEQGQAGFADFLVYGLINIYRIVDLLDVANQQRLVRLAHLRPTFWPAAFLLLVFKSFVMFVLVQRIAAALGKGKLLGEIVEDYSSPHQPIHERARYALPQYGASALKPFIQSLRSDRLSKEQWDEVPQVIVELGLATVPYLKKQLRDRNEQIRALAASSLGRLHAWDALHQLAEMRNDASEDVRRARIEALGHLLEADARQAINPHAAHPPRRLRQLAFLWGWKIHLVPMQKPLPFIAGLLREALSDPAPAVRATAARRLGLLGPTAQCAAAELLGLLNDTEENVRRQAVITLGKIEPSTEMIAGLIRTLKDPCPPVRAAAAETMGVLRAANQTPCPELVELLQDRDEDVRIKAAESLGKIDILGVAATEALVEGLASPDALMRARTAEAIGNIGPAAETIAPALAQALTDGNDRVRAKAAKALGKIGEGAAEAAMGSLLGALSDPDTWVRALAAEALGEMGDAAEDAIPALIRSIAHANSQIRFHAVETLGKLGPAARPALKALEKSCTDNDEGVRALAVGALAAIAPDDVRTEEMLGLALVDKVPQVRLAAVTALKSCLPLEEATRQTLFQSLDDSDDDIKIRAAQVFAAESTIDLRFVDRLVQMVKDDDNSWVRAEAAALLGRLGPDGIVAGPVLAQAVQTQEASVREAALRALVFLQCPETAAALQACLRDDHVDIRKIASAGWRKLAAIPEDAGPGLVEALLDPEPQVRANVAFALSRLKPLPADAIIPLLECAKEANPEVRLQAALALQTAPPSKTLLAVMESLLDSPQPRLQLLAAAPLLKHQPDHEPAYRAVCLALLHEKPPVRLAAVGLIASLGAKGSNFLDVLEHQAAQETHSEIQQALRNLANHLVASKVQTVPPNSPEPETHSQDAVVSP